MNPAESDEVTDLTGNPFERLKKTIVLRNNHSFLVFPLHSFFNLHPDLFVFDVFQEFAAESQGGEVQSLILTMKAVFITTVMF